MFDAPAVARLLTERGIDFGVYGVRTAQDIADLVSLAVRALDADSLERAGFDGSACGVPRRTADAAFAATPSQRTARTHGRTA